MLVISSWRWFVTTTALYTLVSATPTRFVKKSIPLDDRLNNYHAKRQAPLGLEGYLPPCSVDPSYATGASSFKDGEGKLFHKGCENQYGEGDSGHCYTETFVVSWYYENEPWRSTGERIDCAGTKDCTQTNIISNDTCTENKITDENSLKAEFELKLPKWFGEAFDNPDLSFSSNVGTDSVTTEQVCKKTTSSGSCRWDDEGCHGIWTSQQNRRVLGYQRRTCKTGRKTGGPPAINKPEAEQLRNDGLYTIGMQDFSLLVPSSTNVGCAAECDATNYPVPMGPPSRALPIQYAG
ncbi:hypothetical protein XPA_005622 [Xanthoria parietina]